MEAMDDLAIRVLKPCPVSSLDLNTTEAVWAIITKLIEAPNRTHLGGKRELVEATSALVCSKLKNKYVNHLSLNENVYLKSVRLFYDWTRHKGSLNKEWFRDA
jgi:hypothetical protein